MAGLDPAIPLMEAQPCHVIGIAGSSPAMTASGVEAPLVPPRLQTTGLTNLTAPVS
jgi:hypothetical protein